MAQEFVFIMHDLRKVVGEGRVILDGINLSFYPGAKIGVLGHNGAIVWTGITGGTHQLEVPADALNLDWVLGNKLLLGSVNANRRHFEMGIADLALGEATYPNVIERILTTPVVGLDNYSEMMRLLVEDDQALKVFVEVSES